MPESLAAPYRADDARSRKRNRVDLNEGHWRAAAEEGVRLAARQWRIPLENITEMALVDANHISPSGPCYLFKALYTDAKGQRHTGAVFMPRGRTYVSPLSMSSMLGLPSR